MEEPGCARCGLRKKYDEKPRSFLGRLWRWHAGWCPGFRQYMANLPDEERREVARRYDLKKFMDR
jgi:hypothetical protein